MNKKRIPRIISILAVFVFISCAEKTDMHDMIDSYFSNEGINIEKQKLLEYNYFDTVSKTLVYLDNFDNPNTGTWNAFDNSSGEAYYDDGIYKIKAFKEHYYAKDIPYDQNRDFQIEFLFSSHIYTGGSVTTFNFCGFIFNIGQENKGYKCLFSSSKPSLSIINKDDEKDGGFAINSQYTDPKLLTIRKINNKVSFFVNKQWVIYRDFDPNLQPSGIAYTISRHSSMEIDKVVIEYL